MPHGEAINAAAAAAVFTSHGYTIVASNAPTPTKTGINAAVCFVISCIISAKIVKIGASIL